MLITLVLGFLTSAGARSRLAEQPRPLSPTIEMIIRVNDYWQQHHSPLVRSFWDDAAYHTGNMEAYKLLGIARWKDYSERWARHNKWMGAQEKDTSKWRYKTYGEGKDFVLFGDWQICFQTYLDLYEMDNGEAAPLKSQTSNFNAFKIARAIEVMDYEVRQPQTDFWWWADALYMVMPVMTKLYKITGEVKYLDKLYENFKWSDALMYDSVEQLYYRDAKYIYPKVKTVCNEGKSFWARGDGWVLAGLAKVLADMPQDYRHRYFFVQRFRELAEGVARVQRPGGYWSRSMLCEDDAPGPETSGTAFFTYGMLWGLNHGLLDRATYTPVIEKAWQYLTKTALQPDGSVGFVQPIGEKPDPTRTVDAHSQANFGVGAFLLAACEKVRYDDQSANLSTDDVKVSVSNTSNEYRQQVVEIDGRTLYKKLGIQGGRQFLVFDEAGMEVPYQLDHTDKVLLEAGVRPNSMYTFSFRKGTPKTYATFCQGRVYTERKDDYAWENDRTAYRVYGPALQRTGERSFGTDVWAKQMPQPVVEQLYYNEEWIGQVLRQQAYKLGNGKLADSIYHALSYHYDHYTPAMGLGLDLYKVGATLGCGTPAVIEKNKIHYPYCFNECEILDNGPLRTTVHLVYHPAIIGQDSAVVEHRYIQLDKGSNFNRVMVYYEGLSHATELTTGMVLHSEEMNNIILAKDYVLYADPTDDPRVKSCQLFVGTLFPDGVSQTKKILFDKPWGGNEGHALGIKKNYWGDSFYYYFGSAWSKNDVRTMEEWKQRAEWTLRSIRQPLQVKWK